MTNLRALHGQQVKWNFGAIDLFWPGQRGDSKGQPLHPNLRLRWFENISMLFNIGTRMAFLLLLAASLSIHAFVFNPIWLMPPVVAAGLNLRLALLHARQVGVGPALRGAVLPGRVLPVGADGPLPHRLDAVLRPYGEGQLGRTGRRGEGPRLVLRLPGHRGRHVARGRSSSPGSSSRSASSRRRSRSAGRCST